MAELAKKLHFLKNGIEQTAKIYTTTNEVGTNYISVKVDGTTGYVPIGDIGNINATIGMVNKSGNTYTILYSKLPSLTRTTATSLSEGRYRLSATTVGNYALFGGGFIMGPYSSTVDAYDTLLTRTTPTPLSLARRDLAATSVGNYALFGGGYGTVPDEYMEFTLDTVDVYNTSLTRTIPTPLSVGRDGLAATSVGNYALFGGGYCDYDSDLVKSTVDAYDTSLTRTTVTPLSEARVGLAATTVGNYALFGGGSSTVDAYDTSLTRTTPTPLSEDRDDLAATSVGNYALFGGGLYRGAENTVDAYTVS